MIEKEKGCHFVISRKREMSEIFNYQKRERLAFQIGKVQ